jgi:hypothetical protein
LDNQVINSLKIDWENGQLNILEEHINHDAITD